MNTWEVYFRIIPILNTMCMQVMQAKWILAKSITGYIRFMIPRDPVSWQRQLQTSFALSIRTHGCKCRDTRSHVTSSITWTKWMCVSKFHTNDYGSSRESSHTKHSDTQKEFACDAFNKATIELGFVSTAEQLADG